MSDRSSDPRPLPVSGSPRSPVWRWFLGTSTAAAYTLIIGLVMGMLQSAFTDSPFGKSAGTALRGLSWAVLVVAALYVGFRLVSGTRERRRRARELAVTADLIAPGATVEIGSDWKPDPPPGKEGGELPVECADLVRGLDTLPVRVPPMRFSIDAIVALHAALVDAKSRIPNGGSPNKESVVRLINRLIRDGYLEIVAQGRLQRTAEPVETEEETEDHVLATALPALLQHYADLATGWATALGTTDLAQGAARWFQDEEELLRGLVLPGADMDQLDDEQSAKPWRRRSVVVELSRIVDALDVWYATSGRPERLTDLAKRLQRLAKEETDFRGFPVLGALADIRARDGEVKEPDRRFAPHRLEATVAARREHQNALRDLVQCAQSGTGLDAVEKGVERVWWKLASRDVAGEVCALINLAVVHLYQGRLEAAQDRLELAEYLTRTGRDPGGRAHALELRGTVCWARGTPRRAIRYWQRSLDLYHQVGEMHGEARCQQHLGSALVRMSTLGGLVLDAPDGQLKEGMVLRAAVELLENSRSERPSKTADHYLRIATDRLAHLPDDASDDGRVAVASRRPPESRVAFWRTFFFGR